MNNHAHVLRFRTMDTQKCVEYYLNSVSIREYVTGSAQPKLNQQALSSIQIPLPMTERFFKVSFPNLKPSKSSSRQTAS